MDILAVSLWGVFTMPFCKTDFKICYDAMMEEDSSCLYIYIGCGDLSCKGRALSAMKNVYLFHLMSN